MRKWERDKGRDDNLASVKPNIKDTIRALSNQFTDGAILPNKKAKNAYITELVNFLANYQPISRDSTPLPKKEALIDFKGHVEQRIAALEETKISDKDKTFFKGYLDNLIGVVEREITYESRFKFQA
jgi:hypothetical protein